MHRKSSGTEQSYTLCNAPAGLQQCTLQGVTEPSNSEGYHYFGGAKLKPDAVGTLGLGSHINPVYSVGLREL